MAQAVRIQGLNELTRAFGRADRAVRSDLRDALQEAAAPVRADAQSLAATQIRRMKTGSPWTRMRIGVAGGNIVYVAPVERGQKGLGQSRRRPKFKPLMLDKALEPALARNVHNVERRVVQLLDEVGHIWQRTI